MLFASDQAVSMEKSDDNYSSIDDEARVQGGGLPIDETRPLRSRRNLNSGDRGVLGGEANGFLGPLPLVLGADLRSDDQICNLTKIII